MHVNYVVMIIDERTLNGVDLHLNCKNSFYSRKSIYFVSSNQLDSTTKVYETLLLKKMLTICGFKIFSSQNNSSESRVTVMRNEPYITFNG